MAISETSPPNKIGGFDFWRDKLGSPKHIVAPMVDASELAWRLLSRRHGAQLCYTPMLHSSVFCRDPKYRKEALETSPEDRPLIVQFCGNDPKIMLDAALMAEEFCDAIDINLGCPQAIARRGHYGSFLQDEWELLTNIVSTLHRGLRIPVTCKVRVFDDVEKSKQYACMLEKAGCQILTVHGRTRDQKGPLTGLADWKHIDAVRRAVSIPVFANGNVQCSQDVDRCLQDTGVVGVMTAEGNLYNPWLFERVRPPCWEPALEYLDILRDYPCPNSFIRGHLFKLFHHVLSLPENTQERTNLGAASGLDDFEKVCIELRNKYLPYHEGVLPWNDNIEDGTYNLKLPPWLCQTRVRRPPDEHIKIMAEKNRIFAEGDSKNDGSETVLKRQRYEDPEGNEITRKRMKKLRRILRKPGRQFDPSPKVKRGSELCQECPNPLGTKCEYSLCKQCCRNKCFEGNLDCNGHRILVKTRREMAMRFAKLRETEKTENGIIAELKRQEISTVD